MKLTMTREEVLALVAHVEKFGNPPDIATDMIPELCEAWLAQEAHAAGWLPIESAPKDGTDVLVRCYAAATEFVHIAWYRSKEEWEESGQFCGAWATLEEWEGWWSYVRTSVSQEKLEGWHSPTHWMPLPDVDKSRPGRIEVTTFEDTEPRFIDAEPRNKPDQT